MSRWAQTFFYPGSHGFRRSFRMRIAIGAIVFFLSFILSMAARQQALDLSGSPKDPLKETPVKVVVLVFVRTDCPISNRYAPQLQDIAKSRRRQQGAACALALENRVGCNRRGMNDFGDLTWR